ncbi:peptide/nickel transport system permease protein [Rhodococcus sp. 27YEA15]|uniref:ABC transporter permease n=1 Tax=Rhodococcus sp. 27YEA15 TaxID=3156259 RepID=UPI003C7B1141
MPEVSTLRLPNLKRIPPLSRPLTLGLAGGSFALGLALIAAGLWLDLSGLLSTLAVLIGLLVIHRGIVRAGTALWGPGFDAGFWLSAAWLVLLTAAAIFADVLPLGNASDTVASLTEAGNQPPDLFSAHPLGTNNLGLDLLARSIYAARVSLATAAFAVVVALVVGGTLGLVSGYTRGKFDAVVGVLVDAALAFPALLFLVAIASVIGPPPSVPAAVLWEGGALAVVITPMMVRLARANTIRFAGRDFVTASRTLGATNTRILVRTLAPNVIMPLLAYAFVMIAVVIVAEGSLAFLGLGLQQPTPTWGNMIAEGSLTVLQKYPFIPLVPGAFMFLTIFSFNRIGERVRGTDETPTARESRTH